MSPKALILCLNVGQINNERYDFLKRAITKERRYKAARYFRLEDKIRCVIAEVLLKYAVYLYTGKAIDIAYSYNKYGKPFLKNCHNLNFNISHSGEWVVVAVGKSQIGIDVEYKKENWDLVGEKVFSEYEKHWSQNSPKKKAILWTIKEAYVKYLGIGLSKGMDSFSIDLKKKIITEVQEPYQTKFDSFVVDDDYVCSECGYAKGSYYNRKVCQTEIDAFITLILDGFY